MRPIRESLALAGATLTLLTLAPGAHAGEWSQLRGAQATNRADGPALITGDGQTSPGFAWTVSRPSERLSGAILEDVDGNGEPEVLFVASGQVWSLDPQLTGPRWTSPAQSLDGLVGFVELDGDPTTRELVASSRSTGGGFLILDAAVGGLLGAVNGFPTLSGADARETSVYDLDGDGIDELVHPAGRFGVGDVWFSTFSDGLGDPGFLSSSFTGYANFTPAFVGDLLGTGAPAIAIDQGAEWTVVPTCDAGDPGAVCDDGAGTVCICDSIKYQGLNNTYTFGTRWVLNADDDPADEVLLVGNHPLYLKVLAVFDFEEGLSSGSPLGADVRSWYRQYPTTGPKTDLEPLQDGPVDLDGDGNLEIVVSFYNNNAGDTDALTSVPNDDGLNHPEAVSIGVYDLETGDLIASVTDAFAWGLVDLDADGNPELVTSPTTGFSFGSGLEGLELTCNGTCSFATAWEAPGLTVHPALDTFEDIDLPKPVVYTVDTDGDGVGELLAYSGSTLQALRADGVGGVTVPASRLLLSEEEVIADDAATNTALLTSDANVTVLNSGLGTVGAPVRLPSQGWEPVYAASYDGGTRAIPVFSSNVFVTSTEPSSVTQADHTLLPSYGFSADLNGDGEAEVLSYANPGSLPNDDSSFEIRLETWNATIGAFETLWEVDSENLPAYDSYSVASTLHMGAGDFDGTGSLDVVVEIAGGGVYRYLILDGDTGAIDAELTPTERVATNSPLLIADLVDTTGAAAPDGIDDLVINGPSLLSVLSVGGGEHWSVDVGNFIHGVCAYADTDDDGDDELISTLSVTANNQIEVHDDLDTATPSTTWGPLALPLPTDATHVLAVAEVDGVAGDDVLYLSGVGGLHGYSGATGAALPGLPVYMDGGALVPTEPPVANNPLSLLAIDVDDDGYEEAVVGTTDGTIYAVNVAVGDGSEPSLLWTFDAGFAVRALAAADTDGDGYNEILVSRENGSASVLDGIGTNVTITSPEEGDCIPSVNFEVTGTAENLDTVEVLVAGGSISGDVDATSGSWTALAEARGSGLFLLVAQGKDEDGVVADVDSLLIEVGEDLDNDGWFSCADCDDDDPERNPGAEDVCEDGIDQDCDGEDAACGDDDDSAGDDDDATGDDDDATIDDGDDDDGDDPGGCDGCSAGATPQSSSALLAFFIVLAIRRRRV